MTQSSCVGILGMRASSLVLALVATACVSARPSPAPSPTLSPTLSPAPSPTPSPPPTAAAWPPSLDVPTLPPPGPISAVGYPAGVRMCLPDPADHAGFTDTGEFGYCAHAMDWACEFVDAGGRRRAESSAASGDSPQEDPAKAHALEAWMKSHLPALHVANCVVTPASLAGTWAYPDIIVHVSTAPPRWQGDKLLSQPFVRLGGSVAGRAPAFPVTISPRRKELSYNTTELNELALSPDGSELGWVVHSYCGEWCNEFEVTRTPAARFASLVYNDSGFAAYRAGDLAKAKDLFLRAAYIDADAELPAYNLACAYARLGDPHAEAALALAIARGGDKVRARAAGTRTSPLCARRLGSRSS